MKEVEREVERERERERESLWWMEETKTNKQKKSIRIFPVRPLATVLLYYVV